MGLLGLAKKGLGELLEEGYPESVAKKIISGDLPMDDASREARAGLMNMTDEQPVLRGHSANSPPGSSMTICSCLKTRPDMSQRPMLERR